MQITIDTKNDSKEDLKKLVQLLNSIINDENNISEDNLSNSKSASNINEEPVQDGMFSMFENEKSNESDLSENEANKEDKQEDEKKDNSYNIIPY